MGEYITLKIMFATPPPPHPPFGDHIFPPCIYLQECNNKNQCWGAGGGAEIILGPGAGAENKF